MANSAWALYGHLNYSLTPDLQFSGGLRYSADHREADDLFLNDNKSVDFHHTDWDATLKYDFTRDINAYAKVATGYLTGGILRGQVFQPETITSYETGVKSEFWDERAKVNVAAFYNERKNLQITNFGPTGLVLLNQAGVTTTDGVELEGGVVPIPRLHLDGSFGWVKVHFTQPENLGAPDKNVVLVGHYDFAAFSSGAYVSARLDAGWTSRYSSFTVPLADTPANNALTSALMQGGVWDLGARVSLLDIPVDGHKARVSVWVKNLSNNEKPEFVKDLFGFVGASYQVPRTFGLDVGAAF